MKKKNDIVIHLSIAEYLTYIAAADDDSQIFVKRRNHFNEGTYGIE